ncbi:MAG TPA: succinate dehydrogenase, hydrophobic membrane anchor protein [Candidatus Tenderia sp.]|nr:succinate dehydrogenase, hydrophobic membrane anchor protein [Candidatus Tenderia sp.]
MSAGASGYRAWLLQRVSAIYMVLFLLYFVFSWLVSSPANYAEWKGWMERLPMALATTLFFLLLLGHAWVGIRDVLIDYIKPAGLKFSLLMLVAFAIIAMGLWVVNVLLTGTV